MWSCAGAERWYAANPFLPYSMRMPVTMPDVRRRNVADKAMLTAQYAEEWTLNLLGDVLSYHEEEPTMLQKLRGKLWSASRVHLGCKQLYCTKYEPAAAVHGPAEPATPDVPASPGASLDAKRPSYIGSPIVGYGGLEAGSTEPASPVPVLRLDPDVDPSMSSAPQVGNLVCCGQAS